MVVPPGETLVIEPGVDIMSAGYYSITIDQATLLAAGTPEATILFTAEQLSTGWRGIKLENANDESLITYCVFEYARGTGNHTEVRGGALFVHECSPTVSHCVFRFNSTHNENFNGGGGAIYARYSSAVIEKNRFANNSADSGGAVVVHLLGTPIIRGNTFLDNEAVLSGGALYLGAETSPVVEHNTFLRNHGGSGGGIGSWTAYVFYLTYPTIRNNLIAFNSASSKGGGMYLRSDQAIVDNNIVAFNTAERGGGIHAINYPSSSPFVTNTIIWGNTASITGDQVDLRTETNSAISITYSNIQGGWEGVGNIDEDPMWVDPGYWDDNGTPGDPSDDFWVEGDWRLLPGSPCINTGDPAFIPAVGETDLEGHARVLCELVDMGGYEFGIGVYDCYQTVELYDFSDWQTCITGPDGEPYDDGCEPFDFNYDGQVDLRDFAGMQAAFDG